jgi:trans-aconitate methyltransferase
MYARSAQIYDRMYAFRDYRLHAESIVAAVSAVRPFAGATVLEVGCGTGLVLEQLTGRCGAMTGLDINEEMLEIARQRLPQADFMAGDMRDFRVDRRFDVVLCLFGTVAFAKTVAGLQQAVVNMAAHLGEGGVMVLEGYFTPQTYWLNHVALNVVDDKDLKLAWMYRQEVEGTTAITRVHHLVGSAQGVEHFVDTFEVGLFTVAQYQQALAAAGLRFREFASPLSGGRPGFIATRGNP